MVSGGKTGTHRLRTPRDRRESTQVDVYPPTPECPACHQPLTERYHQPRWIRQREPQLKVVSHFLECSNTDCARLAVVYRPHQADTLALRGYTFGLDVVARSGERRYREHLSITKMRGQLKPDSNRSISIQEVAVLCEVFLAFVTTVAHQDPALIAPLRLLAGIVLAIAGVQPEHSHETRSIVREVRSGRGWVAKTLLSSATAEMAQLIDEVLD